MRFPRLVALVLVWLSSADAGVSSCSCASDIEMLKKRNAEKDGTVEALKQSTEDMKKS